MEATVFVLADSHFIKTIVPSADYYYKKTIWQKLQSDSGNIPDVINVNIPNP